MSKYLRFEELAMPSKTGIVDRIVDVNSAMRFRLGQIRWHGVWRQYAFLPEPGTLFSKNYLREIADYVEWMTDERRKVGTFNQISYPAVNEIIGRASQ
jgi:hypothetical protein